MSGRERKMQEVSEKYNNDSYRERHALSVERLRTLPFEESVEDSYIAYFRLVALFLLEVENVRIQVESGKWDQYNEEDMRQINEILYSDIVGDAYEKSYANPKYACSWFEPEMGRLLSFLYVEMRSGIPYAFEGRLDYLTILYELFIEVYTYFENCRADGVRKLLLFHFPVFSYGLYVLSQKTHFLYITFHNLV